MFYVGVCGDAGKASAIFAAVMEASMTLAAV